MVFTASDGTQFDDRNAWRRYEFETNYTFRNQQGQTLQKLPGKIGGQPFDLSDLTQCEVLLLDQSDQVQVDNLTNCRVFIGPSSESVFVRNCTNCTFTVACKQLRTRDCSDCAFYLYSLTDPIIETSQDMRFAPFNGAYNGLEQHFRDARLEPTNNHWSQVYDFNDPDKTGANWRLLKAEEECAPWVVDLEPLVPGAAQSLGPCVNPVARDSGFVKYTESSSSSMQSFTFKTSQKDAEKSITTAEPSTKPEAVPAPACQQQEPARSLPVPPAALPTPSADAPAVPPAPPQALHATVVLPPPAPTIPTADQTTAKVASVEAVEHPTPPPPLPPAAAVDGTKPANAAAPPEGGEPAMDAATAQVTEMIGLL